MEALNFTCPYCNESTKTDERFKYIEDQTYHLKCFNCCNCREPLQNGQFFFNTTPGRNNKLLICKKCHDGCKPKVQSNGPSLSKVNAGLYNPPSNANQNKPTNNNPLSTNNNNNSASNLAGAPASAPDVDAPPPPGATQNIIGEWKAAGSQSSLKNVEEGGSYTVKIPKMSQQQLSNNTCEKCQKRVYENEKHLADGKIWHVNCYRCTNCNTILKGKNGVETVNKKPYCAGCKEAAKGQNYYHRAY